MIITVKWQTLGGTHIGYSRVCIDNSLVSKILHLYNFY